MENNLFVLRQYREAVDLVEIVVFGLKMMIITQSMLIQVDTTIIITVGQHKQ